MSDWAKIIAELRDKKAAAGPSHKISRGRDMGRQWKKEHL